MQVSISDTSDVKKIYICIVYMKEVRRTYSKRSHDKLFQVSQQPKRFIHTYIQNTVVP